MSATARNRPAVGLDSPIVIFGIGQPILDVRAADTEDSAQVTTSNSRAQFMAEGVIANVVIHSGGLRGSIAGQSDSATVSADRVANGFSQITCRPDPRTLFTWAK